MSKIGARALFGWLVLLGAMVSPLRAEAPESPEDLQPCPFTVKEVEKALEVEVEEGEAADMTSPEGREVGSIYPFKGSNMALSVRQTWGSELKSAGGGPPHDDDGESKPIPGDPDGARLRRGKPGAPRVELLYARGKVNTRLMVYGGQFSEDAAEPRVLKLKRVP